MKSNTIGDRIKTRRIAIKLTQEELAILTGYDDRSTVNKIESGQRGLPLEKLIVFAKALKTSEEYLIGTVEDPDWSLPEVHGTPRLTEEEITIIKKLREADSEQKQIINYVLSHNKK